MSEWVEESHREVQGEFFTANWHSDEVKGVPNDEHGGTIVWC